MNFVYWVLVTILIAAIAAYGAIRDATATCQVSHASTYQVFK